MKGQELSLRFSEGEEERPLGKASRMTFLFTFRTKEMKIGRKLLRQRNFSDLSFLKVSNIFFPRRCSIPLHNIDRILIEIYRNRGGQVVVEGRGEIKGEI
jgi:hypothetical protein